LKKIYLIRASNDPFGGAENYLLRLSKALQKTKGIEHEIINSNLPKKILPSWLRVLIFDLYLKTIKGDKFYFSLDRISNADIYRAGDGVHKAFMKIIQKSRLNPLHPTYLNLEKKCFNNAKKIIVNSEMIKNEIKYNYGIADEKISLIYNGFDPIKIDFHDSYNRISKEFLIDNVNYLILFVGSGFHRKGVQNFLKIISQLEDKNFKAFIIGKESNINFYKQLAREYFIEDKVIFTGPRKDVNDFYNISDIFIFPTLYEPFGNVVLEAMSYGNVVFTTKRNGASEIIDPQYVMQSPDDYSVVKKINNIVNNHDLLSSIKLENFEKSKKFSVKRNVNETLRVINEVIN
jgi:UDP-glucose:(heptosyl)LPS alpha-1,3-glucosyltransferase